LSGATYFVYRHKDQSANEDVEPAVVAYVHINHIG